jgi:hypothetical protein
MLLGRESSVQNGTKWLAGLLFPMDYCSKIYSAGEASGSNAWRAR